MKTIYRGNVNQLTIKNLKITETEKDHEFISTVIERDALFYQGIFGRPINFLYKAYLPDLAEATDYLFSHGKEGSNCIYVDYNRLTSDCISNKEFKQLKKQYRTK